MGKKMPDVLYVKREEDNDGTVYFEAAPDVVSFAVPGKKVVVARYILSGNTTIRADVKQEDDA